MVLVDSHGISRVPRYSGTCPASQRIVAYGAVTLCGRSFQTFRLCCWFLTPYDRPYNPAVHARRFGLFRVRSPLLAESLLFSFPGGTEMFQFPRFACPDLWIQSGTTGHYPSQVPPFGHPRIAACLRLPEAYRSLPRPSSLPGAKAFTVRP